MELSQDQKDKYIVRRRKDLEDCLSALEKRDPVVLQRVGHQMKGNALTFGFPELGQIGEELEKAIRAENWEKSREFVLLFQDFMGRHSAAPLLPQK